MATIGDILIQARREAGLSQRELGERLGLAQQQVARWEREGYRCVSLGKLEAVAEALGIELTAGHGLMLAAEASATYSTTQAGPVRDLGGIVARLREHAPRLRAEFGLSRVAVFGSFARGEQHADSDVDLVVDLDVTTMKNLFAVEGELERVFGREVQAGSLDSINPRVRDAVEEELVDVWRAR